MFVRDRDSTSLLERLSKPETERTEVSSPSYTQK
jgi:hypothetical protein